MPDEAPHVTFDYEQGQLYRLIPVDGAVGGPTPSGKMLVALYAEYGSLPHATEHTIEDGQLRELHRHGGNTFTRRIEVGLILDLRALQSLHNWLGSCRRELERRHGLDETG